MLNSNNISEYLKEGVYLQFDSIHIENERNFENGCTSKTIMPKRLNVCILKKFYDNSIVFSRFEVIKYMMANINLEEIKYYGSK